MASAGQTGFRLRDTDGHSNMVKMKEDVTDSERYRVETIYIFLTKYFPRETETGGGQMCSDEHTYTHTHTDRGIDQLISAGTTMRRLHVLTLKLSVL